MGAGAQREEADRRVAREAEVAAARAADKAARAAAAAEYQEPDWVQVHVSPPPLPPLPCAKQVRYLLLVSLLAFRQPV